MHVVPHRRKDGNRFGGRTLAAAERYDLTRNATASTTNSNTVFTLNNVANGALDLVAARSGFNQNTLTQEIDRIIIRRGLNQANGSVIPVIDFGAVEAFAPASANVTVSNAGADQLIVQSLFNTATGQFGIAVFVRHCNNRQRADRFTGCHPADWRRAICTRYW